MDNKEIANRIFNEILYAHSGLEFTTYELVKNVLGIDFKEDFSKLMDIHYELVDLLENYSLKIEYTIDGNVGLPYNIPYIVVEK